MSRINKIGSTIFILNQIQKAFPIWISVKSLQWSFAFYFFKLDIFNDILAWILKHLCITEEIESINSWFTYLNSSKHH